MPSRHSAVEFKKFLRTLDRGGPAELDVHLGLDNASTRTMPLIKRWLLAHPRFVLHFTPTSASWLNLVLRADHPEAQARRAYIDTPAQPRHVETWNDDPKAYVWSKTADHILESIKRYCTTITDSPHSRRAGSPQRLVERSDVPARMSQGGRLAHPTT